MAFAGLCLMDGVCRVVFGGLFLTHVKNVRLFHDQYFAGQLADCPYVAKTLTLRFFFNTLHMANVNLCMVVVLVELYPLYHFR